METPKENTETINMIFEVDESRNMLPQPLGTIKTRIVKVKKEALNKSLKEMIENMNDLLKDIQKDNESVTLKEASINVEFNSEGGISWIGTAKAGSSNSMRLTFSIK